MNTMVEVRFLLLSGPPGVSSTSNAWTQLTLLMPADPFPPSQGGGTASGHPSRGAAKRNLTRSHVSRATPWMALPKKAGPADAGNHMETSRFWGENPSLSPLCRGKSSEKKRPPPPRRAGTIARDRGSRSRTDSSGVFPLPEFALLSLNFLWNSDLAASKLSKEETLRRLWKLPPGRDRKKPHAEYDPRGPSKGGSCFGDECCRVGSASRLGLRSFSRRDSVSDCTQFSLDDVFKSLKIRESPPGFKTAGRKRFIRRSPRVLGGGERGGDGGGKRRGRGLGSAAVPEVTSNRDQDLLCGGATESSGTWKLLPPASSYRRLGGRGVVCKAMLHSWEAGQSKKRRGDPRDRLAWSTCLAVRFSEVSLRPTTGPALPSPAARAQATTEGRCPGSCAGVYGRGCILHQEALEELLGLQIWPYVVFPFLQHPLAVAKPFPLET